MSNRKMRPLSYLNSIFSLLVAHGPVSFLLANIPAATSVIITAMDFSKIPLVTTLPFEVFHNVARKPPSILPTEMHGASKNNSTII